MEADRRQSTISGHTSRGWSEREAELARIAKAQHHQITLAQLRAAGLSDGAVRHRVRTGRLHRTYSGVFSLGRLPTCPNEHRMAAVLACGFGAALSYAAAGAHIGMRQSAATVIDVTSPTGAGRGLAGIRAHRSRTLAPQDVVLVEGVPTTSCARTLLDLAEVLHPEALAKAIDQAEILRLLDLTELESVLARNPGRRGLLPLRALLSTLDPQTKLTKSDFERRLLRLLKKARLPTPEVNATLQLEGRRVEPDFLWRRERFVLETDGWETHRTRQAFERDRAKDALLLRAGYRVVRITWRQLCDEPALVVASVGAGLAYP